ncbi:hypothetical protein ACFFWE_00675 [Sphaerisporangium melleum]|uniref:SHOCT domain-containing protein n=1 Tax=Sphaerisporangium melleum TaxID=321316 RepID=UPI0016634EED|nr:SHOCT domain-containing protein [Sphaerisporangium melleum]
MISPLQLVRRSIGVLLGLGGASCALTLLFLCSRAVMSIGGSCGSGGPYVIAVPCPEGVDWLLPISIFGGLAGIGVYAFSLLPVGPRLVMLGWPALFLSLGYAFLESALSAPEPDGGFLFCGVLFVLMGIGPLFFLFSRGAFRAVFWGTAPRPGPSGSPAPTLPGTVRWTTSVVLPGQQIRHTSRDRDRPYVDYPPGDVPQDAPPRRRILSGLPASWDDPRGGARYVRGAPQDGGTPQDDVPQDRPPAGPGPRFIEPTPSNVPADPGPGDLVGRLERLSALHADGRLDDAEYAAAKARLLNGSH